MATTDPVLAKVSRSAPRNGGTDRGRFADARVPKSPATGKAPYFPGKYPAFQRRLSRAVNAIGRNENFFSNRQRGGFDHVLPESIMAIQIDTKRDIVRHTVRRMATAAALSVAMVTSMLLLYFGANL